MQSNIVEKREKVYDKKLDNTFYNVVQNDLFRPVLTDPFASIVKNIKKLLPEKVSYHSWPHRKHSSNLSKPRKKMWKVYDCSQPFD